MRDAITPRGAGSPLVTKDQGNITKRARGAYFFKVRGDVLGMSEEQAEAHYMEGPWVSCESCLRIRSSPV